MVMRADAYARFQACDPLRAAGATFDLMPPTAAELEDIVARPVAASEPPLAFGPSDPPLAERLVVDAKGGDALPLMQVTLEWLYKARTRCFHGTAGFSGRIARVPFRSPGYRNSLPLCVAAGGKEPKSYCRRAG